MEEIIANDYNCNIPRYVDVRDEEEEIDIDAVRAEIKTINNEEAAVLAKLNAMMKELGLEEV